MNIINEYLKYKRIEMFYLKKEEALLMQMMNMWYIIYIILWLQHWIDF